MKKVLLLGGTGAMGVYLTPYLLEMGYEVDVVSLDDMLSANSHLRYFRMDAMDDGALENLLKNDYNAIVDFLIYRNPEVTFKGRVHTLLSHTDHYLYLSSYRIYANEDQVITEQSPRLLDVSTDKEFLENRREEYSLYKAMGEDILRNSGFTNWTILRPAITYSKFRFQLTTLEANTLIYRMKTGKTVVLPECAMQVQGTMSWAGDVSRMIARLVLNKDAYGEAFTVATAEHHSWEDIAHIYQEIGGLKYITVDTDTYLQILSLNSNAARWQLIYDRCFHRVIDNSKILSVTGMKQSELSSLKDGLSREYHALPQGYQWPQTDINTRMDAYLEKNK